MWRRLDDSHQHDGYCTCECTNSRFFHFLHASLHAGSSADVRLLDRPTPLCDAPQLHPQQMKVSIILATYLSVSLAPFSNQAPVTVRVCVCVCVDYPIVNDFHADDITNS